MVGMPSHGKTTWYYPGKLLLWVTQRNYGVQGARSRGEAFSCVKVKWDAQLLAFKRRVATPFARHKSLWSGEGLTSNLSSARPCWTLGGHSQLWPPNWKSTIPVRSMPWRQARRVCTALSDPLSCIDHGYCKIQGCWTPWKWWFLEWCLWLLCRFYVRFC